MKNKKGFTLVELLAVLIVLIIVVLIAVNVITGRVKDAKKNTVEANANNYVKAVNGVASLSQNIGEDMESGTYQVRELNNNKDIKINGSKPRRGFLILKNYEVTTGCLMYDDYSAIVTGGKTSSIVKGGCTYFGSIFSGLVFSYKGEEETFTAPLTGTYKIETWGAQGGSADQENVGGYGGYSVGYIKLNKGEKLYVNVGGRGNTVSKNETATGGYNGGGNVSLCLWTSNESTEYCGSGGGATSITKTSGLLSTFSQNVPNIVIVAGGGGGAIFTDWGPYFHVTGGSGGGYLGGRYTSVTNHSANVSSYSSSSQFGAGSIKYANDPVYNGSFGLGSNSPQAGGGGGFYGGAGTHGGSGGGTGYIGYYDLTNAKMYCYNCSETEIPTIVTNSTECAEEDPTEECAKKGNGAARITYAPDATSTSDVLYLYSSGNEFNSVTGGWVATNTQSNGRTEKLNNNLHVYCSSTGSSGSRFITSNAIDMSKYKKLHVVYQIANQRASNTYAYLRINLTGLNYTSPNMVVGYYHEVLDISSINSSQVEFYNWDTDDKIMQVWLSND